MGAKTANRRRATHGADNGLSNESTDRLRSDSLEFVVKFFGQSGDILLVRLARFLATEWVAWRHPGDVLHQEWLEL
jgi:hypothetical protein